MSSTRTFSSQATLGLVRLCCACFNALHNPHLMDKLYQLDLKRVWAGKSFLLNRIIERLRLIYGEDFAETVAVTAATGIAATHIGGATAASPWSSVSSVESDRCEERVLQYLAQRNLAHTGACRDHSAQPVRLRCSADLR